MVYLQSLNEERTLLFFYAFSARLQRDKCAGAEYNPKGSRIS